MSILSLTLIILLVLVAVLSIVRLTSLQKNKQEITLDVQGAWSARFWGGLLDNLIAAGVSCGIILLLLHPFTKFQPLVAAIYFAYHVISEVAWAGMTLGKKLAKVKVIGINGNIPSTTDYVVRNLIKSMPVLIACILPWSTAMIVVKAIVVLIYLLVPVFQSGKGTLHDMVAGTAVIRVEEAETQSLLPEEPAKSYSVHKRLTPAVVGLSGKYEGTYVELTQSVMFGRALDCNLVYDADEAGISRKHCSVAYRSEDGKFVLTDLNSTYGTFLEDGTKLERGASKVLSEGSIFWIGDKQRFQFQKLDI